MVKDFFTAQDVARVLDVYEVSARELVDGVIDFEADELLALAECAGVTVERLVR